MPASTIDVAVAAQPAIIGSPACGACRHPLELHDHIATRYCAATASSALSRGCVCGLPAVVG